MTSKMIQALDSEKAHCHDRISIQMVEIYRLSICKPLDIIFKLCIESGFFSTGMRESKCCFSS